MQGTYWENKIQALTKTIVMYEQKDVQIVRAPLYYCVYHELSNQFMDKFFHAPP